MLVILENAEAILGFGRTQRNMKKVVSTMGVPILSPYMLIFQDDFETYIYR